MRNTTHHIDEFQATEPAREYVFAELRPQTPTDTVPCLAIGATICLIVKGFNF
jgi:hypothetical protein